MGNIAIITARGGSKRIPNKNIREFLGTPIIAYSIRAAKESTLFEEVMVSTDSKEIAEIARAYGAAVPFMRSEKNSDDYSTTADVISEVVEGYEKEGRFFEVLCCLYPTAPFVTGALLQRGFEKLVAAEADAVLPVVSYTHPIQRSLVTRDEKLEYRWPESRNSRTQDLEEHYHDAGQFYMIKTNVFKRERTMVPTNTVPLILEEKRLQDIDTPEDWEMAEYKYKFFGGI